ncbi:MAG: restriction endonuclease, partial [Bacteroidetes bacterium]
MDLEKEFLEIIEKKHQELNLGKNYNEIFSKIRDFEGNAIGQIGEEYIKLIISQITEIEDDGIIHSEYDVLTKTGLYFEVKTARKGRTNNTFQFNGINPKYNYDYMICLGVCEDKLLYRIFLKSEI